MRRPIPALIRTALAALTVAVATSGVQAESNDEKKKACAAPDMQTRVIGNKFCFAIRTYAAQTAGPSPTLGAVSEKVTSSFDLPLIRTLGKAFYWQKVIDTGEMANASELARRFKLDPGWVSEVLRMTRLAPDIIRAILEGRQPRHLNLHAMRGRQAEVPLDWDAQRRLFEFIAPKC